VKSILRMRYLFLRHLFFSCFSLVSVILSGQSIPDFNFERWNDLTYNFPTGMTTSGSVTRLSPGYKGNYGIKVQADPGRTQPGEFGFGKLINGNTFVGGIPFAASPDSISGYFAYKIASHDTAWIFVLLKSGGNIVGSDSVAFTSTNTGFYKKIKSVIHYRSVAPPDSLILLICSTRPANIKDTSYILADELSFLHSAVPLPNGDLESWFTRTYKDPNGWTTQNILGLSSQSYPVTDTIDHFAGNFSCRIMNINQGAFYQNGVTSIGPIKNGALKPGIAIFEKDSLLSGYYKYLPKNGDTCTFSAFVFRHDSLIGSGILHTKDTASNWTPFVVPIKYIPGFTGTPDSAAILFAAYNWKSASSKPRGNSILQVDEISFNTFVTGIAPAPLPALGLSLAPNPWSDYTVITFESVPGEKTSIQLYTPDGQLVKTMANCILPAGPQTITLQRGDLAQGVYFLRFDEGSQVVSQKVVVLR
jgi:hypothetical protein